MLQRFVERFLGGGAPPNSLAPPLLQLLCLPTLLVALARLSPARLSPAARRALWLLTAAVALALLQLAPINTGSTLIDEFCERFVYFVAGYLFAARIFALADAVRREHAPHVVVLGHPYVDVWQAIRPQVLGIEAWPVVPRGTPWKNGVLAGLGRPSTTPEDVAEGWRWLLSHVRTYADLEPSLLARVEELIDAVTAAGTR